MYCSCGGAGVVLTFVGAEVYFSNCRVTSHLDVFDADIRFIYSVHKSLLRCLGVEFCIERFEDWREAELSERIYVFEAWCFAVPLSVRCFLYAVMIREDLSEHCAIYCALAVHRV